MQNAYLTLHELGHAHSVEAWHDGRLVGGLFGVAIGSFFAAESMFHYATDASKAALAHLIEHLRARGYTLLDVQWTNSHTRRLGAREDPRRGHAARRPYCRSEWPSSRPHSESSAMRFLCAAVSGSEVSDDDTRRPAPSNTSRP